MTNEQKETIARMQKNGQGYRTIAAEIGLPINSVKSWCRRHPVEDLPPDGCKQCGATLHQTPGKRMRIFCSENCKNLWWKSHPECRGHRVEYRHVCRFCGKEFVNNRLKADYCGRACFARARIKEPADE